MTRNQIWTTVGAVAAALAVGIGVIVLLTSGDDTNEVSTSGARPTASSTTVRPATTPPPTAAATTRPTTAPSTTPLPTVVVVPPAASPSNPPTNPATAAPTSPPTVAPTSPPTSPPTVAPTNPATTGPTAPPTTEPTVPPTNPPTTAAPALDPGITPTEIHIAVIADAQDSVTAMNVWASQINARRTGLGGRKVVIDPFVVDGDASQYATAVKTACTQDFAIVGTLSSADAVVTDLTACGIADLPARAVSSSHRSAPNTYAVVPTSSTKEMVGGFKWLLANVQGCCKQYVIASTNAAAAAVTQQSTQAAVSAGFTSAGSVQLDPDASQSAYTPIVQDMQAKGATFGRSDLPFDSTIKLRTEAKSKALTGVNAWFCLAQCYQPTFLSQGGAAVEDEYVQIATNPFEDAAAIPALKRYVSAGGPQNEAALESYSAGLLFQTAATAVLQNAGKNGLTRAALLADVAGTTSFNANGILGNTNVGGRVPNGCFVMMKVDGGKFVRAEPTAAKTLSCGDQNLTTVGP